MDRVEVSSSRHRLQKSPSWDVVPAYKAALVLAAEHAITAAHLARRLLGDVRWRSALYQDQKMRLRLTSTRCAMAPKLALDVPRSR